MALCISGSFYAIQGQDMANALVFTEILLGQLLDLVLDFEFGTTHQQHPINGAVRELGNPVFGFVSAFTNHILKHALEERVISELFFAQLTRRRLSELVPEAGKANTSTYLVHAPFGERY